MTKKNDAREDDQRAGGDVLGEHDWATMATILDKHSFTFSINGSQNRCLSTDGQLQLEAPTGAGEVRDLDALLEGLHNLVVEMKVWHDPAEIFDFLYKYTKRIHDTRKELARIPTFGCPMSIH